MIAANIMTTGVLTIHCKSTVGDAIKILKDKRVRLLPIVDDDNKVLFAVSPRVLLRKILPGYISRGYLKDVKFAPELQQFIDNIDSIAEKDICELLEGETGESLDYTKISPETSVMEVAAIFVNTEKPVESIMVVDNKDRLLGIISPVDAFKRLWEFAGKKKKNEQ
jgi:CBS-domain-containing membrane protein